MAESSIRITLSGVYSKFVNFDNMTIPISSYSLETPVPLHIDKFLPILLDFYKKDLA